MPVLLDSNSPAGRAELEKQQRIGGTIALAMQLYSALVTGLANTGQMPGMDDARRLAENALVTATVFLDVANAWGAQQMNPRPPPPPRDDAADNELRDRTIG